MKRILTGIVAITLLCGCTAQGAEQRQADTTAQTEATSEIWTTDKTPTKAPDKKYTYTFEGWNDPVADEDGNVTFTPRFTAEEKPSEPEAAPGEKPDNSQDPVPVDKPLPNTGDDGMPYLWFWMIILSVCIAGLLIAKHTGAGRK